MSNDSDRQILERLDNRLDRIEARLTSIEETQNSIAGDLRDVSLRTTLIEKRIAIILFARGNLGL